MRLIYDGFGCLTTLPHKYYEELQKKGIKCQVFNPFRPILNIIQNNRDHRKLCIIDGWVGFTGGINLADEYINQKARFGHWKDTAVMLKGEAVWNIATPRNFFETRSASPSASIHCTGTTTTVKYTVFFRAIQKFLSWNSF